MPARIVIPLCCLFLLLAAPFVSAYEPPSSPAPRPFQFSTDTFAFANETVWNYVGGSVQPESPTAKKRDYTRHCFVLTRAAVQFWKFARFVPDAKPLAHDEMVRRIREVTGRSVWLPGLSKAQRIAFPGYANLRELSKAEPGTFQANIGLGWPIYFRPGNAPIAIPASLSTEARLNDEIYRDLRQNYPTIVWLYKFPSLKINHVVVIFAGRREGKVYRYTVYDPNYADAPKRLTFDAVTRTFSYQPTFFFTGGEVTARAIYRGVMQ
jgi:hypothetical protein